MIHVRNSAPGAPPRFVCGLGPDLPIGDHFWFAHEAGAAYADCPGCKPPWRARGDTPDPSIEWRYE